MTETVQVTIADGCSSIYALLDRPAAAGRYPAVIMSHGYMGSHSDFNNEARLFVRKGFVVCRFDFCGGSPGSKSSGRSLDMTIYTELNNLLSVFAYIEGLDYVDSDRIFLMGASQGGFVSMLAAEELKNKVRALMLYYPAFCIPDDFRRHFPAITDIPDEYDLWGMLLGRDFSLSIRNLHPYERMGEYDGPVFIIHGDKDGVVDLSYSERAVRTLPDAELIVFEGEGHGFSPLYAAKGAGLFLDFAVRRLEQI